MSIITRLLTLTSVVMPSDASAVMPSDASAVMPSDASAVMPGGEQGGVLKALGVSEDIICEATPHDQSFFVLAPPRTGGC